MTERNIPDGAGARFHPSATPKDAVNEFASRANRIGTIKINLETAREDKELRIAGNFLWAVEASDLEATLGIKWNEQAAGEIPFGKGLMIRGVEYNTLYLTNEAQSGKFITLMYAVEADRNIEIANPLISATEVRLVQPTNYTGSGTVTIADGTTDTIPSRDDRREITIQTGENNTGPLEIRDANNNTFAILNAGDTLSIPGTDVLNVRNNSGDSQNYRYVEVRD